LGGGEDDAGERDQRRDQPHELRHPDMCIPGFDEQPQLAR
jgi:hypothetical protein